MSHMTDCLFMIFHHNDVLTKNNALRVAQSCEIFSKFMVFDESFTRSGYNLGVICLYRPFDIASVNHGRDLSGDLSILW